jgi:23S rRNA pseudouridine1911/1915/1917 synthase
MVVHPAPGNWTGTLVNALMGRDTDLLEGEMPDRAGIVHRLDRETSGALVVARTDRAHHALAAQFQAREVEKIYLALVHGKTRTQGRVTTPIARDPVRRVRMTTKLASGREALTEYRLLEAFERLSYLEVRIGTGRTHQIRVHLASIRHPVFGDRVYGAPASELGRFFLHAHQLQFRSPSTSKVIRVESPLAAELATWLNALRLRG